MKLAIEYLVKRQNALAAFALFELFVIVTRGERLSPAM
jgi:hypothetical protein